MAIDFLYKVINSELIVISTQDRKIAWKGKPKGYAVKQIAPVKESDDCIVLLEWLKSGQENERNLLRINPYGGIVWEVGDPPKEERLSVYRDPDFESYPEITNVWNHQIVAFSHSGFSDTIDIETGKIIKSEFVG